MGKSTDHHVAVEQEFASLERSLNQTADEASNCLRILKKELSEYDSRHGNHFTNTAKSYLRSDIRTAKDTASDLKHVAHQISRSHKPSQAEIDSARNMMNATTKAMDVLKTTARNYDHKNGKSTGVTGAVKSAVGKNDNDKDNKGGLFDNKNERHDEKQGGLFGSGDKDKNEKGEGLFGMGNKDKDEKQGGFLGMGKDKDTHGNHGRGGILGGSDTVESLVKSVLRDHFTVTPLSHQINATEKALSPSFIDKAKEKISDVKEKLTGDKHSPTHEGHRAAHPVNP